MPTTGNIVTKRYSRKNIIQQDNENTLAKLFSTGNDNAWAIP